MNEKYPINVEFTNQDDVDLEVHLDALLQPAEDDSGEYISLVSCIITTDMVVVNTIIVGEETSTSLIKGVAFGIVKSGQKVQQTLYLLTMGSAGQRVIDISVQSRTVSSEATATPQLFADTNETLRTLVIPTVNPLHTTVTTAYHRRSDPLPSLLDLKLFEADVFETEQSAAVAMHFVNSGPCELEIQSMKLLRQVCCIK